MDKIKLFTLVLLFSIYAGSRENTALLTAAQTGKMADIKAALESGAEINTQGKFGETPLMWAARNSHASAVEYLLQNGAQVDIQDYKGLDAVWWATMYGDDPEIVSLLKKYKHR